MKNATLLSSTKSIPVIRWSIWMVIPLLMLQGNELKAVHTLPNKSPSSVATISPCDFMGSHDYNEKLAVFKDLSLKEKRQAVREYRQDIKKYKSKCPQQYKLYKHQKAIIFWTDAWHVGLAIILFPVSIVVAIVALAIYLLVEFPVEDE